MTSPADLLTTGRVRCKEAARSKKRVLEIGAGLLAADIPSMSAMSVFEALNTRERLGSTGLGHGMALPHGRVGGLAGPIGACITLAEPVDFDAPDRERVDVLFLLLVPKDCSSEHLKILAALAELFNDARLRDALREQTDPDALVALLREWSPDVGDTRARGSA